MSRRKNCSRYQSGERFAAVHEDVLKSDAYRWLPHFARSVLFSVASRYRGFNNGGLELTVKTALEQGINKSELYAGLRLCMKVGLLRQTSPGKRRSGKGIPAKYAITWRAMNDFPVLNLIASERPGDEWQSFVADAPRPRSLTQSEILLGIRREKRNRNPLPPDQESIEVSDPTQTKTRFKSVTSHTKRKPNYESPHTDVSVTAQTKKKQTERITERRLG